MEKFQNPYDKAYMKMAILKHEEMFREQVFELHRLYQIQKTLMKDVSTQSKQNENILDPYINFTHNVHQQPKQTLDLEQPVDEELDRNSGAEMEVEGEIKLTLGPSSYYPRRKAAETPLTSDSGLSFSSSSTGSSHIMRTTSKIHIMTERQTEELTTQKRGLVDLSNSKQSFLSGRRSSSDTEQERLQQPPWLCQVLSLNMA